MVLTTQQHNVRVIPAPAGRSGFERLVFRLTASGSIDDKTNIACFAVFARRKTARSRADDGVFRQSLVPVRSECKILASCLGDSL